MTKQLEIAAIGSTIPPRGHAIDVRPDSHQVALRTGKFATQTLRASTAIMKTITLYVRPNCCLCRTAHDVVSQVRESHPFALEVQDVDAMAADDPRRSTYALDIPVVEVDGKVAFKHQVSAEALVKLVTASGGA